MRKLTSKRLLANMSSPWLQDHYFQQAGQCYTVHQKERNSDTQALRVEDSQNNEQPDATKAQKKVPILDGMA